ncbi:NAD(P)/FAD-dependent oxidoreductase [Lutimonas sp.]|uniref:NAD(P)/FAD-dependent oxidoreductase n=1 Tax=Lutimonas sp. TaxID=1872403 RepID=UPI003D9BD569
MSLVSVVVVGGGLAGLTSSLHLSRLGIDVTLVEKNDFPRHKVCGEYLSNEVLPYLNFLGIDPFEKGAKKIRNFEMSSVGGTSVKAKLPLGGFSISRYSLDEMMLLKAKDQGVVVLQDTVLNIEFKEDQFILSLKNNENLNAVFVIGAYGKRSILDQKLNRSFFKSKAPFLAVKSHFKGEYPEDLVGLHHFYGGYCGVSNVEGNRINICYITEYDQFKKYKNIEEFQQKIMHQNGVLKKILENSEPTFEKPITISQISFAKKQLVEHHILMSGDSAGMIHPLSGNGMSMAIRSAKIISELIGQYFNESISRSELEKQYEKEWNKTFKLRLRIGRVLASLFRMKKLTLFSIGQLKKFPNLLSTIIRMTHGKLIETA